MWTGCWGPSCGWFGWIMPLIGLLFMVMMVLLCFRGMGGCMAGHGRRGSGEIDELRAGISELREDIGKLRERS